MLLEQFRLGVYTLCEHITNTFAWLLDTKWTLDSTLDPTEGADSMAYVRESVAYDDDGTQVAADTPVYDSGIRTVKETTNLLTANQSSVETDTTGFTGVESTITRDTTEYWNGSASLKVETNNATTVEGVVTNPSTDVSAALNYTFSCYVKGSGTVKVILSERDAENAAIGQGESAPITLTSSWQEVSVSRLFGATGVKVRLLILTQTQQAATFYVDGLQLEQSDYATPWHIGAGTRTPSRLTRTHSADLPATFRYLATIKPLHASTEAIRRTLWRQGGYRCYIDTDGKATITDGVETAQTTALTFDALDPIETEAGRKGGKLFIRANVDSGGWVESQATADAIDSGKLLYVGNRQTGLYFDGVDDNLAIVDDQDITGTVEFWMKGGSTAGDLVDFTGDGGVGKIRHDATDIITTSGTVYVNGSAGNTYTQNSLMHVAITGMTIDSANSILIADGYKGLLYDFRLWNTTRTAQQVADNMNKRLAGDETGLQLYLPMDEAEGTGVDAANDLTSNNNHGEITGASWQAIEPANGILYDIEYYEEGV